MLVDSKPSPATALEHLKIYIDVYKHHFDLYIKAHVVLYGILGVIAGYVFSKNTSDSEKVILATVAAVGSLIGIAGSIASYGWVVKAGTIVNELEKKVSPVGELESRVPLVQFPFDGTRKIVKIFAVASGVLFLTAVSMVLRSIL